MGATPRRRLVTAFAALLIVACPAIAEVPPPLEQYRDELHAFREEFGGSRDLPDVHFFLFGTGPRTKLLYKDGVLRESVSGRVIRQWKVKEESIVPCDYAVELITTAGGRVRIFEDEGAVWVHEGGRHDSVDGTRRPVRLPTFDGYRYPRVMRVLHQELLVNVVDGKPVPNAFVYPRPWYRDGAMMAMCFQRTGNLDVIRDWVLKLDEPFDRNNGGESEADNLGQALYLISLVSDKNHPLVEKILSEMRRFEVAGTAGKYIKGRSDFAEHPVYQTKWAKLGLAALGLPDPYVVPRVEDSYSALFWMAYKDAHVTGKDADDRGAYPYLGWACDHFHGAKKSPIGNRDYPLTWEQNASQAKYEGMNAVSDRYTKQRLAAPHTWHAAEVLLYLLQQQPAPRPQPDFANVEIKTTHVAKNIYMLTGEGGNIGVSAGPDGLLIVDDQFAPLAPRIETALRDLGKGPLKFVLNTHHHGDHTGGNAHFSAVAPIIAHANARRRLLGPPGVARDGLPVVTFDESLSLHFNGEEVKVFHVPPGHTDGDVMIHFTGANVVHLGDQFFNGRFPNIDLGGGGDVRGYIRNVETALRALPPDAKLIPGHGPLGSRPDLQAFHEMLSQTSAIVEKAIRDGRTLEQVQADGLPEKWKGWEAPTLGTRRWLEILYRGLSRPAQPAVPPSK